MNSPLEQQSDQIREFVPNPDRFYAEHDFDNAFATLHTIRCVGRWADRAAIWPLGHPGEAGYDGPLPEDLAERDGLIARAWQDVHGWLERSPMAGYLLVAALLWRGDVELLDMHDADFGHLFLTAEQASILQEYWGHHDLPADLYIPSPTHN